MGFYKGTLPLKGFYKGTQKARALFLGTKQIRPDLPIEYKEVEYVYNGGGTMIDLGWKPTIDDMRFYIETKVITGSFYILQSRSSLDSKITGISGSQSGDTMIYSCSGSSTTIDGFARTNQRVIIDGKYKDGVRDCYLLDKDSGTEYTGTGSYSFIAPPTNVCMFGNYKGDRLTYGCYVYDVKCYEGGELVLDLIPCKRMSDDIPGFYNVVDGTFFTATEGTLYAGPEV